jgi:hypothetical protein
MLMVSPSYLLAYQQPPTPTPDPTAQMTTPADGAIVFGAVIIRGTVNVAGLQTYRLDYLTQPDGTAWQPIGRPISQTVREGVLGQWETASLKDGLYLIRLRVILRNGTVLEDYVTDVRVQNTQPTALPTIPVLSTQTPLPPPGLPTATSPIVQPPTNTPRPTSGVVAPPLGVTAPPTVRALPSATPILLDAGRVSGDLTAESLQAAVCNGAIFAMIGFVMYGLYNGLRGRTRA